MSRLPLIDPDASTGKTADLLDAVHKAFGITPNMTKVMANSPAVLKAYLDLVGALNTGSLPAGLRERIAILVAQENGCDYCLSAHTYIGTHLAGLDAGEAARARTGRSTDPRADAALSFATAVVRSRGGVDDTDLKAARLAGLTDGEIAEIVANVALNVFTNYLNKTADTEIDWPIVRHDH